MGNKSPQHSPTHTLIKFTNNNNNYYNNKKRAFFAHIILISEKKRVEQTIFIHHTYCGS